MLNLGIVASTGGSAFGEIAAIVKDEPIAFTVITDRPCGIETIAETSSARVVRIENPDRNEFSVAVRDELFRSGITACLLFFNRLVGPDLFDRIDTFNIHPSLLPAYPGFQAVNRARQGGVKLLGATLHKVDETVDGGRIEAQVARRVDPAWPIERWNKISFLQKVYLGLVWTEMMSRSGSSGHRPLDHRDSPDTWLNASHGILSARRLDLFRSVERRENIQILP